MRPALRGIALSVCASVGGAAAQDLERVEITGSRLPRIDAETALPVQVIRRDEIERSGATTAEEAVARIAANFGGHNEALGLLDGALQGFSGASLRGYGEGATLVLLNGRRLANYAFSGQGTQGVDLHAIPLAALDRIEVLKDGASALYGSDAIAGVINFITRRDFTGAEATASYGDSEHGGGGNRRATLTLGTGDMAARGFNLFGVLDVQRSGALRAVERPFAATTYRPEAGFDGTLESSFPMNVQLADGRFVNPAAPACTPSTVFKPDVGGCWYDDARDIGLLPRSDQINLLLRGTLRLAASAEAYAEASMAWDRVRFRASTTPVGAGASPTGLPFVFPASSPFYPAGLGLTGDLGEPFFYRTAPLGPRINDVTSRNRRLLAGVKGQAAGWDVDAAIVDNDSRTSDRFVSGFVDAARMRDALATGLINPFGDSGPAGDALLAAAEVRGTSREAHGRTQSIDLNASRDLAQLAAGRLAIALGAEARRESLSDAPSQIARDVLGRQVYRASKDGSRRVQALFAESIVPLVRGVEAQLAARLDHYSDFGTSINPKLALRVQPAREWLMRASVGRGFRAPSLPELFTAQQSIFGSRLRPEDPLRCPVTGLPSDCALSVLMVSGGNPDLRPEHSKQASAGIVFEPNGSLQIAVDAWALSARDTIGSLNPFQVLGDLARFEGRNVVRGPVDPVFPNLPGPIVRIVTVNENIGSTRSAGVDLAVVLHPAPTPIGRFSIRLDGAYLGSVKDIFDGEEFDLLADEINGGGFPRWQHTLTFGLDRGPWHLGLAQRYRRGYQDVAPLPDGSLRRVPAYGVWDAHLGFELSRGWSLALGVKNLFDRDPPFASGAGAVFGYDPGYADPRGRFWSVTLTARWR
jgi:iron complex outermembrane recepter protein